MAIAFARARYISRSDGGSAVRSAAYNGREAIKAERTGEVFYFKHREAPEHHEVLLPDGAPSELASSDALWNAAERSEKRKDAQLARELVLALPANAELNHDDRVELARSFAIAHFVSKGLAVQLDVHAPHGAEGEGERANYHAHLLITTRRLGEDGFAAKKARDLDPVIKRGGGRAIVAEGEAWGELWRDHQNRYFAEQGLSIRVDATGAVPQEHIGPIRMRTPGAEANIRAEHIRRANEQAARDPEHVLAVLTRNQASFSEYDLDRHLKKHIRDEGERGEIKGKVLGRDDVLALHDRETGDAVGRWTTRSVREQEREALGNGRRVAGDSHRDLGNSVRQRVAAARALRPDQQAAFEHATGPGGLKIVEGRAGTGKSYALGSIRDAHELAGYHVVGLAPTNAVTQTMKEEGFGRSSTVHAELFRLKNGRVQWDRRTLVVVDEAAMMDAKITGEVLREARLSGAKVVLVGDDRQLGSIERGGLFTELKKEHGSAEWQKEAARDLSDGRFEEALRAFARNKSVVWTTKQAELREKLVEQWAKDSAADPSSSRFVFAYTNKDVGALNMELRAVRRERGELGEDFVCTTKHGEAPFAVGDRVQFTDTLKGAGIYNGNAGVITRINQNFGRISVMLDAPAGREGRKVEWYVSEFNGFRHGYAGTIYKGQGKTLDHTYLLHTHHWRAASSYVALTRQRESARIFVATETARDLRQLARQIGRNEIKSASVAYATFDELSVEQRSRLDEMRAAEKAQRGLVESWEGEGMRPAALARQEAAVRSGDTASELSEQVGILIPPFARADANGVHRDSLGRGLDDRSVAAAVDKDADVQRERAARELHIRTAYRDAKAATERLEGLIARDGATSAGRRVSADPSLLGELRGKEGLFAGVTAREERQAALRAAAAIGPNVVLMAECENRTAQAYRADVERQMKADATAIPALSERASAALAAVAAAKDDTLLAETLQSLSSDGELGREIGQFTTAVKARFGADDARAMLRASAAGQPFQHASVPQSTQPALDRVATLYSAARMTERETARITESEHLSARQNQGARMKP